MSVHKDNRTGKWFSMVYYDDAYGKRKQKCKRGFKTKREALDWESEFLKADYGQADMLYSTFAQLYMDSVRPRLKENTVITKENIFEHHILPYFGKKKLNEITPAQVANWQVTIMKKKKDNGEPFSPLYLKTIHNQLSASFNYAVRFYHLPSNPAAIAGNMGKTNGKEMLFWTRDEYSKFSKAVMDKPMSYYAFEVLYWTGMREGELLALTPDDFDFEAKTVRIDKSYQRLYGTDVITDPKTPCSIRTVTIPDFLCEEVKEYLQFMDGIKGNERLFPITKHFLWHEMRRGSELAGVKRIRVHDLRHSHVSLLIDMGLPPIAIAARVGHKSISITFRYAHLFPSVQNELASKLNNMKEY